MVDLLSGFVDVFADRTIRRARNRTLRVANIDVGMLDERQRVVFLSLTFASDEVDETGAVVIRGGTAISDPEFLSLCVRNFELLPAELRQQRHLDRCDVHVVTISAERGRRENGERYSQHHGE